jgi:7-carboxy-7-deazaguanine synthase
MKINDIFYSVQGEGLHVGQACLFVRFFGCNLTCSFCDTKVSDFVELSEQDIFNSINAVPDIPIVITGGEPLLNLKEVHNIVDEFSYMAGRDIIIETNGTQSIKGTSLEHNGRVCITVSPKTPIKDLKIERIDCLKLLYPYLPGCSMVDYIESKYLSINNPVYQRQLKIFIQPIDNDPEYVKSIINHELLKYKEYQPSLSVQIHKIFKLK